MQCAEHARQRTTHDDDEEGRVMSAMLHGKVAGAQAMTDATIVLEARERPETPVRMTMMSRVPPCSAPITRDGAPRMTMTKRDASRSEERRVGKEWRSRG